jgi:N-methylhydantoinase A
VLRRDELDNGFQQGPALIEEYDSTTVVPPRCRVARDDYGNIVLEVGR